MRLGNFIVTSGLKPGDKLPPERELMDSLGVGRSTLREAVKALRAVGAIDVVAGGGMYVGRGGAGALTQPLSWAVFLNAKSTQQAVEARRILEEQLAGLAASRISDEELRELSACVDRMHAAGNDSERYLAADLEFHMTIAAAAKNDILYSALDMLQNVVRAWIRRVLRRANGDPVSLPEHLAIFEALAAHNPARARRAMAEHLEAASCRLLAALPDHAEESGSTSTQ